MTKMLLIGDIHGKWESYARILEVYKPERSVQLGDFGIGFQPEDPDRVEQVRYAMDNFGDDNRYIRGNHDNPQACLEDPRWIHDATFEEDTGIFYLGGAWSIDRAWRTEGLDWWPDEEMSYEALGKAIDLYEAAKPRVVLSHECPEDIVGHMFPWYRREFSSRTRDALSSMRSIHKPELHIFGHWHSSVDQTHEGTRFICLNELKTMTIEV